VVAFQNSPKIQSARDFNLSVAPLGSNGNAEVQLSFQSHSAVSNLGNLQAKLRSLAHETFTENPRMQGIRVTVPPNTPRCVKESILDISNRTRPIFEDPARPSSHISVQRVIHLSSEATPRNVRSTAPLGIQQQLDQIKAALDRGENVLVKIETEQLHGAGRRLAAWLKDPRIKSAQLLDVRVYGAEEQKARVLEQLGGGFGFREKPGLIGRMTKAISSFWSGTLALATRVLSIPSDQGRDHKLSNTATYQVSEHRAQQLWRRGIGLLESRLESGDESAKQVLKVSTEAMALDTIALLSRWAGDPKYKGKIHIQLSEELRVKLGVPPSAPKNLAVEGAYIDSIRARFGIEGAAPHSREGRPSKGTAHRTERKESQLARFYRKISRQIHRREK
jgi:hypothetical protein